MSDMVALDGKDNAIVDMDTMEPESQKDYLLGISELGKIVLFLINRVKHKSKKSRGTAILKFGGSSDDGLQYARCCGLNDTAVFETASGSVLSVSIESLLASLKGNGTHLSSVLAGLSIDDRINSLRILPITELCK